MDIYNFAMEKVTTIRSSIAGVPAGTEDRSVTWDGSDSNGRMVDNGVYFFRANVGGEVSWGKVVVIN
ncbi:MAG: hypothetical protein R3C26_14425 [Calditrichia bacterium]